MKVFILISVFISIIQTLSAQSIKGRFTLRMLPDNGWVLEFSKNNTFRYYHWNGWGGETTLDSGNYTLQDGEIHLASLLKDTTSDRGLPNSLYVKKLWLNKYKRF